MLPLLYHIICLPYQGSLKKWCSSGVVSAVPLHEIIDFTGFLGTFQDTAVADEKYFNHIFYIPPFPATGPTHHNISYGALPFPAVPLNQRNKRSVVFLECLYNDTDKLSLFFVQYLLARQQQTIHFFNFLNIARFNFFNPQFISHSFKQSNIIKHLPIYCEFLALAHPKTPRPQ